MLFSSLSFLYLFLPAVFLTYALVPKRWKNPVLLAFSLLFYFCGEPVYVLLLLFSSLSDYLISLFIEAHRGQRCAKTALILSLLINLGMLGFFKYSDFFLSNINGIFGTNLPLLNLRLPIGISFFTFQTMSYTIDVYRGTARAQKNIATFATFVCLFPQLVAGPIVRYTDISTELQERTHSVAGTAEGARRFLLGLGKKVILANSMGELCAASLATSQPDVLFSWLYALAYCFQIYFDFSGYSDMAIGLGKMLGFSFPENFDYPYISRSITEFWRRWHKTLGAWFRDYVYIPMGGNRVSKPRWVLNLLVVWMLTGLWHGAAWNFVVWGLFFGFFLVVEKLFLGRFLEKIPRFFQHLYVLLLVLFSFLIFSASSLSDAGLWISRLFGAGGIPLFSEESVYFLRSYGILLVLCLLGCTPAPASLFKKLQAKSGLSMPLSIGVPVILCGLFLLCTAFLVDGSFNPFLYFRF